ncbi:MAG: peptidoglycan-binding protein [Angustibacter sp.]
MRRRAMLLSTAAVLVGGAGIMAGIDTARSRPATTGPAAVTATDTAQVTRGTLRSLLRVTGSLGYLESQSLSARREGTITALPKPGAVLRRGDTLAEVNLRPIPIFYGALPVFRTLQVGTTGPDVSQLERNLTALGFGEGLLVNEKFTSATAQAVRAWQKNLGVEQTGKVEPGDVAAVAGAVRVSTAEVGVGASVAATDAVLVVTSIRRGVTVDLDAAKAPYAAVGSTVVVTPSIGDPLTGRIRSLTPITGGDGGANSGSDESGEGNGGGGKSGGPKVRLLVEVTKEKRTLRYDTLSTSVDLIAEKRRNVLSVPVEALVAVDAGKFVVTIIDSTARRQVRVTTGMFAEGRVEVVGELKAGDDVEVPTL